MQAAGAPPFERLLHDCPVPIAQRASAAQQQVVAFRCAVQSRTSLCASSLPACPHVSLSLIPVQWVGACRETLKRMGQDRIALAQLHWSTGESWGSGSGCWRGRQRLLRVF